ncbi:hypothetical protein HID58_013325 [Brassica napus]|uniref:BnaA03g53600D protein n=3 Tax=Brassica TaxID=3705 RepID=A0A078HXV7_BRANA|nr:hypothetical protein HID58_013325 [Brassica napus]CAF2133367.1 unnamed protein product [Brassica napus]CDY42707.1 BnaA03g53600D [Brassica napus]VDC84303.1 unnamed protein product [Brassica rapa]
MASLILDGKLLFLLCQNMMINTCLIGNAADDHHPQTEVDAFFSSSSLKGYVSRNYTVSSQLHALELRNSIITFKTKLLGIKLFNEFSQSFCC